jgi:glutamate carboxypeptidase
MKNLFFGVALSMVLVACTMFDKPSKIGSSSYSRAALDALAVEAVQLTSVENEIVAWLAKQESVMVEDLRRLVDINTGTLNKAGHEELRGLLQSEMMSLGFEVETKPGGIVDVLTCEGGQIEFSEHLLGTIRGAKGKKLLINGHMDTVFPVGHPFDSLTIDNDLLKGPGAGDMKGGIVILLYALRSLKEMGLLDDAQITLLFNSDEEMGSLGSRPLIEALAREHDYGLVFEGTHKNNMTRARKGLGQFRVKVTGRSSHAGGAHEEGLSAVKELSHKIIEIEKLTDYDSGVTVNVGMISGGEARNTVPPCADAYIDLRYPEQGLANTVVENISEIVATSYTRNEHLGIETESEVWHTLHRPAKEATPESDELLSKVLGINQALGYQLGTQYSGGGTDGSIMQGVGLPTVDSLGINNSGAHSPREQADLSSLVPRAQAAAILIYRLTR